jgi:hypothetical protein
MMKSAPVERDQAAEFVLAGGCMLCAGDIHVKVTPNGGAYTCCGSCRWISHPSIEMGKDGLQVSYTSVGQA